MKRLVDVRGLGSVQVIFLLLGFLLASILIFVFGFALGQEMALRHTMQTDRVVRGTVASRAALPTPSVGVSPGFYKDMEEKAYQRAEQAGAVSTATTSPAMIAATSTPLRPTSTPPRLTATVARPTATRRPVMTPTRRSEEPTARVESSRWSIEVGATKNAQEAIAMTMELRRLGHQSYTAQAQVGADTWYRVRVGRFGSRAEAEAVEQRIRQDPRFSGAHVTSQ